MHRFSLDKAKTIEAAVFALDALGNTGFHKLFKVLYFAERKHLARYGRPITGDEFVAMKNGPVPSWLYDVLKEVRSPDAAFADTFDVVTHFVEARRAADVELLSETDQECLLESVQENEQLSFAELTQKSHDSAWDNATRNNEMRAVDIAEAEGANNEMLRYIKTNLEHQAF